MPKNAKLTLVMDRDAMAFTVDDANSTRILTGDGEVDVVVNGWTLDEVTSDEGGKTRYEPHFQIVDNCSPLGAIMSDAALEPVVDGDGNPIELEDGTYSMSAKFSTNTRQYAEAFGFAMFETSMYFTGRIISTTFANPIADGAVIVWNFPRASRKSPDELPPASRVLSELRDLINEHAAERNNPHGVTAQQIGALTKSSADSMYAGISDLEELSDLVSAARSEILLLQRGIIAANGEIIRISNGLLGKADASSTYRKDQTYNKAEVQDVALKFARPLAGKMFRTPATINEAIALLARVASELGANIGLGGEVLNPDTAPNVVYLADGEGFPHGIRIRTDEWGNTLEVE